MSRVEAMLFPALAGLTLTAAACGAQLPEPLPDCVWCGTAEAPPDATWQATIAGPDEPGERLVLRGTVYQPDGETPAADVILYIYQTNAAGIYAKRGDVTGNGRRHGYLRGWVKTDERGRYEIRTVVPGHYPNRTEERHIHLTVKEPDDTHEYVLPNFLFAGDPLLEGQPEGPHVLELVREDHVWLGRRDIVLPEAIEAVPGQDGPWYRPAEPGPESSG